MAEARENERLQEEAAKKAKEEKIQAAAKLENEIATKDKQAAEGIAPKKTNTTKKAVASTPVEKQTQMVSRNSFQFIDI